MKKVFKPLDKKDNSSIIVKEEIAMQFAAPFHFHQGFEFTFIVNGSGKFYGGNRLLNFSSGELYFFGVGFPHLFVNEKAFVKAKEIGHSIVIQFDEQLFGHEFLLRPEFSSIKEILKTAYWGIKIAKPNAALAELLFNITKRKGLQTFSTLLDIFHWIADTPQSEIAIITSDALKSTNPNKSYDEKLEPVYQYVLGNFKKQISTSQAAALAFMNDAAFCRYFKRRTNQTLSQFVNNVRITHAVYLLSENNMSISDICYECGYENLSYFNRQFKLITGKTPLTYRKQ